MNNPKTAIQEIKKLMKQFGFLAEEKFFDVKLVDGTTLKVDGESLEAGAKILVITEEGEIPAPNGEYELEDGSKIEVADGVITEVKSMEEPATEEVPAEPTEELVDEPVETPSPEETEPATEPIAEAVIEALTPVLEEIKSLTEQLKAMRSEMESVKNDFEAFKKEPAARPIKSGKIEITEASSFVEQKLSAIRSLKNKK